MKIVNIAASYFPNKGGVETHLFELNTELVEMGHQVTVITQQQSEENISEMIKQVSVLRIPRKYKNKKFPTWKWIFDHREILFQADIIQVHDVFWWLFPVYTMKGIFQKVFTTFHGWEGRFPVPWRYKLARYVYSLLSQKTIHIGGYIQEFYWDKPTLILYGAVPSQKQRPTKNKKEKNKIVFIGRLSQENAIEAYCKLFSILKISLKDAEITWVGDGALKCKCKKLGEVTGMISQPSALIADADIVFANSYLAILDSQAQGKKVVSIYTHDLKKRYLETYPYQGLLLEKDSELENLSKQILEYISTNKQNTTQQTLPTWKEVTEQYVSLWMN